MQRFVRQGFTLFEIVIAVSILVVVLGFGLAISPSFYAQQVATSERDTLASLLVHARSEALNNLNQSSHGVEITPDSYTVFQGSTYAARNPDYDETFPRTAGFAITGPGEIVFNSLDASVAAPGTITMQSGSKTLMIIVNGEGGINY